MPEGRPPKREEVARILDYLPYGRTPDSRSYQKQPLVQAVGEANFVLMEMTPKGGRSSNGRNSSLHRQR